MTLKEKLHPKRFPNMSPKMGALVACILNEDWTVPRLMSLFVTSDNMVLAMEQGDIGYNHFIGSLDEVSRNWENLLNVAGVTRAEWLEADTLYQRCLFGKTCAERFDESR
jgi:hypothetical protein